MFGSCGTLPMPPDIYWIKFCLHDAFGQKMDRVHFLDVWGLSLKAGQGLYLQIPPGLSMAWLLQ